MATQLPLTIAGGAIPPNFRGTLQEFAQLFASRLYITTQQAITLIAAGSTAPTSNEGPWANTQARTFYFFNETTAAYEPMVLLPESLEYIVSQSAPDPTKFQVWFRTASSGQPTGVSIYYNGAWTDAYGITTDIQGQLNSINSSITTLNTLTATSASQITTISGQLSAAWGVDINVDGKVTGRIKIDGTGATSTIGFLFDRIELYHPANATLRFDTTSRVIGDTPNHNYGTGVGFAFTQSNPAVLCGVTNGLATTPNAAPIRDNSIQVLILASLVQTGGWTGDFCVYMTRNAEVTPVVLASIPDYTGNGPVVLFRELNEAYATLNNSDIYRFFVAPCDGSGDIPIGLGAFEGCAIDVISLNW